MIARRAQANVGPLLGLTKAMAKAQEADAAGDKAACEQALEEVERTIRH
jgi:hypothetical protein